MPAGGGNPPRARREGGPGGERARQRLAELRAQEARRRRRRRWLFGGAAVTAVALAALGISLALAGGSGAPAARSGFAPLSTLGSLAPAPPAGPLGPELVPIPAAPPLAGTAHAAGGQPVDGIRCQASEKVLFHIHAHLAIVVDGAPRQVPAGIGIPGGVAAPTARGPAVTTGTCFYWLHTHAADGIIHTESPVNRTYTLGDFFDEWGQPLGRGQVGPARGHVTALVNRRVFLGSPRDIPLTAHAQIQLEVGRPLAAPERISWRPTGL